MIFVRLHGGLGNQLFQYAAGRRLSLLRNAELVFEDSTFFHPPAGDTPRRYLLDCFDVSGRLCAADERAELHLYLSRFWKYLGPIRRFGRYRVIYDSPGRICQELLNAPDRVVLSGYWQSEVYFSSIRDVIRKELCVLSPMSAADSAFADRIRQTNSVSIHIRRGDYVHHSATMAYHGVCSLDYYQSAIKRVIDRIEKPEFFVFSDDPEWVQRNIIIDRPWQQVIHTGEKAEIADFHLMSMCRHHIIANSSFSWWGAWLGERESSLVVAPQRWFASVKANDGFRVPDRWHRL